jgi:predicted GNAT family N-acyltransferase
MTDIQLVIGDWASLGLDAARVRDAVFVREQQIPADLEWDDADHGAVHAVAYRANGGARTAIGTGRLLPTGYIGRLAVVKDARTTGVGTRLLDALVSRAFARGDLQVRLYAQYDAVRFYLRYGFERVGHEFVEAGIRHVEMARTSAGTHVNDALRQTRPGRDS